MLPLEDVDDAVLSNHTFIIVAGAHLTGTSTTERLLSSQKWSSGLRPDLYPVVDMKYCPEIDLKRPSHCQSHENEGSFLSFTWKSLFNTTERRCEVEPFFYWGRCANKQRLLERDVPTLKPDPDTFRRQLLRDWALFWNLERPYLVQKDIPNSVQSSFLQSLLGADKTYFVFSIRHPLASCKYLECDTFALINAWILLYETMAADLEYLDNYLVLHQEIYFINGTLAVEELKQFLGWNRLAFVDGVQPHVEGVENYASTTPQSPPTARQSYPPKANWSKEKPFDVHRQDTLVHDQVLSISSEDPVSVKRHLRAEIMDEIDPFIEGDHFYDTLTKFQDSENDADMIDSKLLEDKDALERRRLFFHSIKNYDGEDCKYSDYCILWLI